MDGNPIVCVVLSEGERTQKKRDSHGSHAEVEIMSFKQDEVIMKLFIENAKTYIQLSTGALVLSITFIEKVLGEIAPIERDFLLIASWAAFLFAVGSGAFYQYLAVKYLDSISDDPGAKGIFPKRLIQDPGKIYGMMILAFYAGAILFTIAAVKRMY